MDIYAGLIERRGGSMRARDGGRSRDQGKLPTPVRVELEEEPWFRKSADPGSKPAADLGN
jgi:hypothetical protein